MKSALRNCISLAHEKNLPFVVFSYPNKGIKLFIDLNFERWNDLTEDKIQAKGFLFHPFQTAEHPTFFIKNDWVIHHENAEVELEKIRKIGAISIELNDVISPEITQQDYENILDILIQELKNKFLEKVVFSKIKSVNRGEEKLPELFELLCENHTNAFVYFLNIPGVTTWMGASPEQFVKTENKLGKTTSLAGTRAVDSTVPFNSKEEYEQQVVTDYISKTLVQAGFGEFNQSDRYEFVAGPVKHLKTDFTFDCSQGSLLELIHNLHPTPAVCGIPQKMAFDKIHRLEDHDREYYAGFMGLIDGGDVDLFVNLRCMKINQIKYELFLGGGITSDSNPLDEWKETENKAKTMLLSIEKLRNFA